MAKKLDVDAIIAKNASVNRDDLVKGITTLKELEQTGAVRRSSYELQIPDHNKVLRHSEEEVCIKRGATIRLSR